MSLLTDFKTHHQKLNIDQLAKVGNVDEIPALILGRAHFFDVWLTKFWESQLSDKDIDAETNPLSLIAVGGYGRGELHPFSDIDVLILVDDNAALDFEKLTSYISQFITSLWDMKLNIGHSVRTLSQTLEEAKELSVATSLLETRLIAGSQLLYQKLDALVKGPIFGMDNLTSSNKPVLWDKKRFFKAKNEEQINRHAHYQDALYNLEPNIKNGPGGLRDLHTMDWLMYHYAGTNQEKWLIQHKVLTENEFKELRACRNFLWAVRFALHFYHHAADERLSFDAQRQIALWQSRQPADNNIATNAEIECFMQKYYRTIAILNRLSHLVFNYLSEALFYHQNAEAVSIDDQFQSRNGYLEIRTKSTFTSHPESIFTLFSHFHHHPNIKGIDSETLRSLNQFAINMTDDIRQNTALKMAFLAIWKRGEGLTHTLRKLHRYGVLENYLPDFATICGRMQFDLFHAYTVDQHALMAVKNTRRLDMIRFAHENPHCFEVMQKIKDKHLVHLSAFLHDIGKGRGGDHATIGADIALNFCHNHSLNFYETLMITWLVREHLIMSRVAQKQDINDPEVIKRFAITVGTQERLNCLYVLTIADISATNPKLLNAWRSNLLKQLYEDTQRVLTKGRSFAIDVKEKAFDQMKLLKIDTTRILTAWKNLPEWIFQRYSVAHLVLITRIMLKKRQDGKPWISLRHHEGILEILIYQTQQDESLSISASCLSALGLSILEAKIIQCNNQHALFIFNVLESNIGSQSDKIERKKHIKTILSDAIVHKTVKVSARYQPKNNTQFYFDAKVLFGSDTVQGYSVLELIAPDKLGLLATVAAIFNQNNIILHHAKINTFGLRVEDIFFLSDPDNKALSQTQKTKLKDDLFAAMNI